jgi:hypothetical protein
LPAVACLHVFKNLEAIVIAQWAQYIPNIPRQVTESVGASEVIYGGNSGPGTTSFNG